MSCLAALVCLAATAAAQPYVEGGNTRHRFAQLYVGGAFQGVPGSGHNPDGTQHTDGTAAGLVVSPVIGGLHFWGHADFYVRFPIAQVSVDGGDRAAQFSPGVETGAKLFPWRIEEGKLRPYVGFDWSLVSYRRQGEEGTDGPVWYGHRLRPQIGCAWLTSVGLFDAGVRWMPSSQVEYPVSRTERRSVALPPVAVTVVYSVPFETTLSAERLTMSGYEQMYVDRLAAAGKLDGPSVGIGLSSAFSLSSTDAVGTAMSLDLPTPPALFPEVSLGYYHHHMDAAAYLLYRSVAQEQSGYGLAQEWSRRSLALEGVKFLADYHGFVPFVGGGISYEQVQYRERLDDGRTITTGGNRWAAGVVLGWDIRPNRLQWFTLRTAVRYTPSLAVDVQEGGKALFDHLEVNFFHLVVYPTRLF